MATATCDKETNELFSKGKDIAETLIELLQEAIAARRNAASKLRSIADDLDDVNQNVNVGKIVGTSVSMLGGIGCIAAIALTGGAAAPLALGVGGAVLGGATNLTATLIGQHVSQKKLEEAQEALDENKDLNEQIGQKSTELLDVANRLSNRLGLSAEEVYGLLMIGGASSVLGRGTDMRFVINATMFLSVATLMIADVGFSSIAATAGKGATITVAKFSVEAFARALGVVVVGVVVVYDAVKLVSTIVDTVNGSPTAAAESLRVTARKLDESASELESDLEKQRKYAEEIQLKLRERFLKLVEKVSKQRWASEWEKQEMYNHINNCASDEWKECVQSQQDLLHIVVELCHIIRFLENIIKQNRDKIKENGDLTIIMIGHGGADSTLLLPSQLYFMNPSVKDIWLYSPWGCAVDANVVYGIATGMIQPLDRTFISAQPGQVLPYYIKYSFNDLPKSSNTRIPTATFYPISTDDPAYQDLLRVHAYLQAHADGLVIEFASTIIPLPKAPLWVITNALGILGALFNVRITFRYAACLSWESPTARSTYFTNGYEGQYCMVESKTPPELMSCTLSSQPSGFFVQQYTAFNNATSNQN